MVRTLSAASALALALAACADGSHGAAAPAPDAAAPPAAKAPEAPAPAAPYEKVAPSKDYPLTTCVVSGDGLDEMGEPIAIRYEGREVQFCCPACIKTFLKDPTTYLAKLDAAAK